MHYNKMANGQVFLGITPNQLRAYADLLDQAGRNARPGELAAVNVANPETRGGNLPDVVFVWKVPEVFRNL